MVKLKKKLTTLPRLEQVPLVSLTGSSRGKTRECVRVVHLLQDAYPDGFPEEQSLFAVKPPVHAVHSPFERHTMGHVHVQFRALMPRKCARGCWPLLLLFLLLLLAVVVACCCCCCCCCCFFFFFRAPTPTVEPVYKRGAWRGSPLHS